MEIRMEPEALYDTCLEWRHLNREAEDQLLRMDRIILETQDAMQGESAGDFAARLLEMRRSYGKIIEFHDALIAELESLVKDYQELEFRFARKIKDI